MTGVWARKGQNKSGLGGVPRMSLPDAKRKYPGLSDAEKNLEQQEDALLNLGGHAWLDLPELPSPDEVMSAQAPVLPTNHPMATYPTYESYVEVQYRLIRHEGVELLRRAVTLFRQNPRMSEATGVYIYDNVRCSMVSLTPYGMTGRFQFCMSRMPRLVDWDRVGRLKPGTCVALSPASDNFRTVCQVAVVSALGTKKESNRWIRFVPDIELKFDAPDGVLDFIDPHTEYVMIEASRGFFTASRHVLTGLKQTLTETSPLRKYLNPRVRAVGFLSSVDESTTFDLPIPGSHQDAKFSLPARGDVPESLPSELSLDRSQARAVQRMLASDLSIIQGPPGTGKTYTSLRALEVLLKAHKPGDPPILITAQKNDTVDELLLRLIDKGYRISRYGAQTKHKKLLPHEMHTLSKQAIKRHRDKPSEAEREFEELHTDVRVFLQQCFTSKHANLMNPAWLRRAGLITKAQSKSILRGWTKQESEQPLSLWLEYQYVVHQHAVPFQKTPYESQTAPPVTRVFGDTNNQQKFNGGANPIRVSAYGKPIHTLDLSPEVSEAMAKNELKTHSNLWDIQPNFRSHVYSFLHKSLLAWTKTELRRKIAKAAHVLKATRVEHHLKRLATLKFYDIQVIGCTVTGLLKFRPQLAALGPTVMLVEEAGEVKEADIAASILPSVRQLMLVGDHLQLKPRPDVIELARSPYNLEQSLFERLVKRGVGFSSLQVQRRMAPEIRKVLNAWYPQLQDNTTVLDLPGVPGMGLTRRLWLDHQHSDAEDRDSSRINDFEAQIIIGFARYLVMNGTEPDKITVLSFYAGQKAHIQELADRYPEMKTVVNEETGEVERPGVDIQTVDGFQGRENDVVLLSVTRSPSDRQRPAAGFLDSVNRTIVAFSRARLMNAVFGNMSNLLRAARSMPVWSKIEETMREVRNVHMPMVCVTHSKGFVARATPMVWQSPQSIGCGLNCGKRLSCGHVCGNKCHPLHAPHRCFRCQQHPQALASSPRPVKRQASMSTLPTGPARRPRPTQAFAREPKDKLRTWIFEKLEKVEATLPPVGQHESESSTNSEFETNNEAGTPANLEPANAHDRGVTMRAVAVAPRLAGNFDVFGDDDMGASSDEDNEYEDGDRDYGGHAIDEEEDLITFSDDDDDESDEFFPGGNLIDLR